MALPNAVTSKNIPSGMDCIPADIEINERSPGIRLHTTTAHDPGRENHREARTVS